MTFDLASEPIDPPQRRTIQVRVWPVGKGQTPVYSVMNASGKAEHASFELVSTDGQVSCKKDGSDFGPKSKPGRRVQVHLIVQGESRVRVSNLQVTPVRAVVASDQPVALRDLETLRADPPSPLDAKALVERFGAGVVAVHSGRGIGSVEGNYGGLIIGTTGLVLTSLQAVQSGIVEVTCQAGDERVTQLGTDCPASIR